MRENYADREIELAGLDQAADFLPRRNVPYKNHECSLQESRFSAALVQLLSVSPVPYVVSCPCLSYVFLSYDGRRSFVSHVVVLCRRMGLHLLSCVCAVLRLIFDVYLLPCPLQWL